MKLTFILLLCILAGCSTTKNTMMKPGGLNGTWLPVSQVMNGSALPSMVFEKNQLIIKDDTYSYTTRDKGTLTYGNGRMDIYGKDGVNAGKHYMAIYKFEKDQLIICYNLKGDSYPDTYETKGKPMYFVSVYKKA